MNKVNWLPGERSSLTASIQPLEQDPRRFHQERLHRTDIERHIIVLNVSSQFRTEYRPDVFHCGYRLRIVLPQALTLTATWFASVGHWFSPSMRRHVPSEIVPNKR